MEIKQGVATLFRQSADWEDGASLLYRTKNRGWRDKIKKTKQNKTVSCKYFLIPPDSRYVLISSFLQPLTSGPGQVVSCELNKGF